jgi:hypothetical protein
MKDRENTRKSKFLKKKKSDGFTDPGETLH